MTEAAASLYDELGVSPGASQEALRAGYRQQARRLHPDVADEATTGDAMRRLNEAWAILGDPERRRLYDESRVAAEAATRSATARVTAAAAAAATRSATTATGAATAAAAATPPSSSTGTASPLPDQQLATAPRRIPFLRPSALALVILAVLFVITAYAGSWPGDQSRPPASTGPGPAITSAPAGVSDMVIGQCATRPAAAAAAGQVTVVPCSTPHDSQVLAQVATTEQCPAGTIGHAWQEASSVVCLVATNSSATP